jgi:hypothetical protein
MKSRLKLSGKVTESTLSESPKKKLTLANSQYAQLSKSVNISPEKSKADFYAPPEDKSKQLAMEDDHLSSKLNKFECRFHPHSTVNKILYKHSAPQLLYCSKCAIEADITCVPFFTPIDKVFDDLYIKIQTGESVKVEDPPPKFLLDVLESQFRTIDFFTDHISKEKERITASINTILESIKVMLAAEEKKLHETLEAQLTIYKTNIEEYRRRLNKYFLFEKEPEKITRDKIYGDYNESKDVIEAEARVKSFMMESEEAVRISDDRIDQVGAILQICEGLRNQLVAMSKTQPALPLGDPVALQKILDPINRHVVEQVKNLTRLTTEVFDLKSFKMDSSIAGYHDIGLLRKWFDFGEDTKIELVGKAEPNGANFDALMEKTMDLWKPLIIAKTQNDEKIGCYRITQKGCMTFSLSTKEIKKDNGDPIQKIGLYSMTPSFMLTWKQPCRYNAKFFEMIKEYGVNIYPNRAICLVNFNFFPESMDEKKIRPEQWARTINAITELEVFQVINNAKDFPPLLE